MGWAKREADQRRRDAIAAAATEAVSLAGLRIAVDVQHLYRDGQHAGDRGSIYTLQNGNHVAEADAALSYAHALRDYLAARSAKVLTNQPDMGVLVGPYSKRNQAAAAFGVHAYLACHVNAGGGSYARCEYLAATPGQGLGEAIGLQITAAFPSIHTAHAVPLAPGERGNVCVEACDHTRPAIILEPFFGDNPSQQGLFAPDQLVRLGQAIGAGVGAWWAAGSKH